jgi:hypothetical protein
MPDGCGVFKRAKGRKYVVWDKADEMGVGWVVGRGESGR